jgi:F-type H+-transporting ATPase subunit gamma
MANLKEIRTRLATVISTRQITSAMKMVSAAKLRKAQDAIIQMRPYAQKLHEILFHCEACFAVADNKLLSERPVRKVLIIVISSNRGLCGSFNVNVAKSAIHLAQDRFSTQFSAGLVDFLAIGRKGAEYMRSKGYKLVDTRNELFDDLTFENSASFIEMIIEKYLSGEYDHIELVFNRFKNALMQIITNETFLPLKPEFETENLPDSKDIQDNKSGEYIIEPSNAFIVERLIPKMLKTDFYKALLDSSASEHGARMTAMHKATDNASQLITELRLTYNKARQSTITNEIIEIVGGAESLGK